MADSSMRLSGDWPETSLLYARLAAVRAIQGNEMNIFSRTVQALAEVSKELQAPIALCGGLAAIHYGAPVTTSDVDIVVPQSHLDRFLELAEQHGFVVRRRSAEGWHQLTYSVADESVHVEVVPEGRKSPRDPDYAPPTPGPAALGVPTGLDYVSFGGWVQLKLVSNRDKDRYHLIEVLKLATETQIVDAARQLRPLDPRYLQEFQRLLGLAQAENQHHW